MPGIDEAAAAFTADIARESGGSAPAPISKGGGKAPEEHNEGPPIRMFENVGELEIDDESPEKGGGDDAPDPSPRTDADPGDEDEDPDADPDADSDGEDEDPDADPEDKEFFEQKVTVTVDGEEQEVSVKEALEGYTRTATFHKRMNDIEQAKQVIARTAQDVVQNYEHASSLVGEIEEMMKVIVPAEPDWDAEFKANPIAAREKQKYFEQIKTFRAGLKEKIDAANAARSESARTQTKAFVEEESRKFNAANAKAWTDPKRKTRDLQSMRRTAMSLGFTEEEINTVYDSRMLTVLLKASKYDRMMASKPKPVGKTPGTKVVRSGNGGRVANRGKNLSRAMKQLNKTGRVEDAGAVFAEIISNER